MKKSTQVLFITLKTIANTFILSGILYLVWTFFPIIRLEASYVWAEWFDEAKVQPTPIALEPEPPANITPTPIPLASAPINTDAAIIIEKINVNSPIALRVSVSDKDAYFKALEQGVAHANGTALPSEEPGNTYLFAHSTPNPLEIKKYAAEFTLLNKLALNDRITIMYENKRYDYVITESKIVKSFDLSPLLDPVEKPTLTLQTCDPPGIPINRLIVRAELVGVYDSV